MNSKMHRVISMRVLGWHEDWASARSRRFYKRMRNKQVRAERKKEVDNGRLSETES